MIWLPVGVFVTLLRNRRLLILLIRSQAISFTDSQKPAKRRRSSDAVTTENECRLALASETRTSAASNASNALHRYHGTCIRLYSCRERLSFSKVLCGVKVQYSIVDTAREKLHMYHGIHFSLHDSLYMQMDHIR